VAGLLAKGLDRHDDECREGNERHAEQTAARPERQVPGAETGQTRPAGPAGSCAGARRTSAAIRLSDAARSSSPAPKKPAVSGTHPAAAPARQAVAARSAAAAVHACERARRRRVTRDSNTPASNEGAVARRNARSDHRTAASAATTPAAAPAVTSRADRCRNTCVVPVAPIHHVRSPRRDPAVDDRARGAEEGAGTSKHGAFGQEQPANRGGRESRARSVPISRTRCSTPRRKNNPASNTAPQSGRS